MTVSGVPSQSHCARSQGCTRLITISVHVSTWHILNEVYSSPGAVPVLGTFHVTLTDIYLEGLDVEEARTGLALGADGAFTLHVEDLQVCWLAQLPLPSPPAVDPAAKHLAIIKEGWQPSNGLAALQLLSL